MYFATMRVGLKNTYNTGRVGPLRDLYRYRIVGTKKTDALPLRMGALSVTHRLPQKVYQTLLTHAASLNSVKRVQF